MRKLITVAIPIATMALFICIMLSSSFLKKPFGKNDDVVRNIKNITQDVNNEAWDRVDQEIDDLEKAWKKVVQRIQFSSERDEINYVSNNIARLRGAAMAKDKANSLIELKEAFNHFKEIGK